MLLPNALSIWNIIIARTYFQNSIPNELKEAAFMDGCSNTKLFLRIVLPLSKPLIAVLILFYSVGHWNAFFNALIYLSDTKLFPLQLFLRNILIMGQMQDLVGVDADAVEQLMRRMQLKESMKFGIIVVSSLPVLVLYPFLQKYFVKGVMIGAIKG
jgi:putative aldouronate transport system permease protein